jgi:hypothetical protein
MKMFCLTIVIAVFWMIFSNGMQAQTTQMQLDQLKLMEQFLGTWQENMGNDSLYVWEFQKHGKTLFANTYYVTKNQKTPHAIVCYGFDRKLDKIKGYSLFTGGGYGTWIASFTSQNVFHIEVTQDLNPATISQKVDCVFENPNQWTMTTFNKDGIKVDEVKNIKVK